MFRRGLLYGLLSILLCTGYIIVHVHTCWPGHSPWSLLCAYAHRSAAATAAQSADVRGRARGR